MLYEKTSSRFQEYLILQGDKNIVGKKENVGN